ncbi:unnamed protein product [Spodoptera littoralis]|uniref:PHD-type domain-containing protein n=1 Tax=Spodoptera littoralis TaxID=7109 RepID=A0A9P0IIS7_SPOLI|nr:unnamed protein product [Spodoptera littoralis]CAH1647466.1 unnamed protein product [Spodoptera littoralis]
MSTNICAGCLTALEGEDNIQCFTCFKLYDLICANINKSRLMTTEYRDNWKCPECMLKQPKIDNSNTPVRSTQSSFVSPIINSINISKKIQDTNINCVACRSLIVDGEECLSCSLDKCQLKYHIQCSGKTVVAKDELTTWICPECVCHVEGKANDDNISLTQDSDMNITFRKKIQVIQNVQNQVEFQELTFEMSKLRLEMEILKEQLSKAVAIITNHESKLTGYSSQIDLLNTQLKHYSPSSVNVGQQKPVCVRDSHSIVVVPTQQQHQLNPAPPPLETPTAVGAAQRSKKKKPKSKKANPKTLNSTSNYPNRPVETKANDHLSTVNIHNSPAADDRAFTSTDDPAAAYNHIATDTDRRTGTISDQNWTEVRKNKPRQSPSLCGIAGPDITTLRAVEPRKYMHLWNMESSANEIRDYLQHLCPTGTCTVEELRTRGSYKSFKIGVPIVHYEKCFSVDVWPVNARIKAWIDNPRRIRSQVSAGDRPSPRTFRA